MINMGPILLQLILKCVKESDGWSGKEFGICGRRLRTEGIEIGGQIIGCLITYCQSLCKLRYLNFKKIRLEYDSRHWENV